MAERDDRVLLILLVVIGLPMFLCGGCLLILNQSNRGKITDIDIPIVTPKAPEKLPEPSPPKEPYVQRYVPPDYSVFSNPVVISLEEYSQIQTGMDQERVIQIVRDRGTETVTSDIAGTRTWIVSWENKDGSNANAMFQNGKLIMKAQYGLK